MDTAQFKHPLGAEAKDKISGFEGIIVGRIEYLFGCAQYGISPKVTEAGKPPGDTIYFDEGRIEVTGLGIKPEDVQSEKPGGVNRDAPRR